MHNDLSAFYRQHSLPLPKDYMPKGEIARLIDQVQDEKYGFVFNDDTQIEENRICDDIALIQCFYGTDISRIEACQRALSFLLRSSPRPAEWIFVEAQKTKNDACFQWLKSFGVKYVFMQTTSESDGIFLKTPLWNVGVLNSRSSKLCFVDADVAFCQSNWLEKAIQGFEDYDVMSLASYCYYEGGQVTVSPTLGQTYLLNKAKIEQGERLKWGRSGLTVGMTRDLWDALKGFDSSVILDDVLYWYKVLGYDCPYNNEKWMIHGKDMSNLYGIDAKLGAVDTICCHLDHGPLSNRKYSQLFDIIQQIDNPQELFVYDYLKSKLPVWQSTLDADVIRRALKLSKTSNINCSGRSIVHRARLEIEGPIDESMQLVIQVSFTPSFKWHFADVVNLFNDIKLHCKTPFTAVCVTNIAVDDSSGIIIQTVNANLIYHELLDDAVFYEWDLAKACDEDFTVTALGNYVSI